MPLLIVVGVYYFILGRHTPSQPWDPAEADQAANWNILLVSLDTTRPDHLAACGGGPVATPGLDRVAGGGFLFTEMITPAPNTLPAHASLLTGQNPYRHGVRENVEHALPAGAQTLAELLRDAGYTTAAFVAAFVMNHRFGLAQGFELYEDRLWGPEPGLGPQTVELRGGVVADRAIRWVGEYAAQQRRGEETRPFFLFVHFFDAHAPYAPPPVEASRYPESPYDGELAYQDACLGRLLDALEVHQLAQHTLVWVVSDHGEGLGEHGEPQHSIFVYDATVRAVSVLRTPPVEGRYRGGRPRMRIGVQTSLISVGPTILDLTRRGAQLGAAEGVSLLPWMREESSADPPAYCETLSPLISYHWAPLYAVRTTERKYIRAPQRELYNLVADPGEATNLAAGRSAEVAEWEGVLGEFLARAGETEPTAQRMPTNEERERLRSLGYLAADGGHPDPGGDLPDPKEMIRAYDARYKEAMQYLHRGRFEEAASALREALRVDPLNNSLYLNLANALRGAGRPAAAGAAFREALRIHPDSPRAWHGWGQALLQAGQADSAVWAFNRSLELLPASPDPWSGRAGARWLQRRFRSAAADFDSALARGGDPILLHGLLARLYRDDLADPEQAERHLAVYARLRRLSPEQAAAHLPQVR